jgi:hypothetical protein
MARCLSRRVRQGRFAGLRQGNGIKRLVVSRRHAARCGRGACRFSSEGVLIIAAR